MLGKVIVKPMLQDLPCTPYADLVIVISVALGPGKLLFLPGDWFFEPPHHLTPIHADAPQGLSARSEAEGHPEPSLPRAFHSFPSLSHIRLAGLIKWPYQISKNMISSNE